MKLILITASLIFVASCSQIGAQKVRSTEADGEGPLIPNCYNLSETSRVETYITKFYMTTSGSAAWEGAANGIQAGFDDSSSVEYAIESALSGPNLGADGEKIFNDYIGVIRPYCRAFAADRRSVATAVSTILSLLGNTILVSDIERGIFKTDLIDRTHDDLEDVDVPKFLKVFAKPSRWKDAYSITVTEERTNRVIVKIQRSVYISRIEHTREDKSLVWSSYHQAKSIGHNEAWVFTQIADLLAGKGTW